MKENKIQNPFFILSLPFAKLGFSVAQLLFTLSTPYLEIKHFEVIKIFMIRAVQLNTDTHLNRGRKKDPWEEIMLPNNLRWMSHSPLGVLKTN